MAEVSDFGSKFDVPAVLMDVKKDFLHEKAVRKYKQLINDGASENAKQKARKEEQAKRAKQEVDRASKLRPDEVLRKWADETLFNRKQKQSMEKVPNGDRCYNSM